MESMENIFRENNNPERIECKQPNIESTFYSTLSEFVLFLYYHNDFKFSYYSISQQHSPISSEPL